MNRGRIIVLMMAVAAAGLAMILMKNMVKAPETRVVNREVSKIHVLVANADISLGGQIKSRDLKWQPWPGSAAKGYITKRAHPKAIKEYTGSVARFAIGLGDPIRDQKLVKAGEGGVMAAILPAGKRAISIKISNAQGVSGLILPNDRVDIILTSKKRGSSKEGATSGTLLSNIRVLAIGTSFETKNGQKSIKGKHATLALDPAQVETVTKAGRDGQIWLSLRALADNTQKVETRKAAASSSVKVLKFGVASQVMGVQ